MSFLFFFNDTATTEIYTLSLHDALPISDQQLKDENECFASAKQQSGIDPQAPPPATKTEEQKKAEQQAAADNAKQAKGGRVRGAARGAAGGAAIGAIADDEAGKGAGAGAAAGTMVVEQ